MLYNVKFKFWCGLFVLTILSLFRVEGGTVGGSTVDICTSLCHTFHPHHHSLLKKISLAQLNHLCLILVFERRKDGKIEMDLSSLQSYLLQLIAQMMGLIVIARRLGIHICW